MEKAPLVLNRPISPCGWQDWKRGPVLGEWRAGVGNADVSSAVGGSGLLVFGWVAGWDQAELGRGEKRSDVSSPRCLSKCKTSATLQRL